MNRILLLTLTVVGVACSLPSESGKTERLKESLVEDARCKPDSCGPAITLLAPVCEDGTVPTAGRCLWSEKLNACVRELPYCSPVAGTESSGTSSGSCGDGTPGQDAADVPAGAPGADGTASSTGTGGCSGESRNDGGTDGPPTSDCSKEECGVAPGAPEYPCADGSIGGAVCVRHPVSKVCGYIFRQCAQPAP